MRKHLLFLLLAVFGTSGSAWGACSSANLTRCLDSVCAINISSNPSARCQYCGTSSAGTPPTGQMRSVSVGQSSKNTISDKELKKAPAEPDQRYVWATTECLKKVAGCTPDDVTDIYDSLIEQSCKAAGISAQMTDLRKSATKTKTSSSCDAEIRSCMISEKNCGMNWSSCEDEKEFSRIFADCSIQSKGCEEYLTNIRTNLISVRDTYIQQADTLLENIVAMHQSNRAQLLAQAQNNCKDDLGREECIRARCATNMPNKCEGEDYKDEKSMATKLCTFYDLACGVLK